MTVFAREFRSLLTAATMLAATVSVAHAVPPSGTPVSFGPQTLNSTLYNLSTNLPISVPFVISVAGDYSYGLGTSGFSTLTGAAGFLGLSILNSEGFSVADLSFSALSNVVGSSTSGTFQAGSYTMQIGAYGVNFSANNVTASFAAVAVPGPIAGAGLPLLLGFAGYAAWRRRSAKAA